MACGGPPMGLKPQRRRRFFRRFPRCGAASRLQRSSGGGKKYTGSPIAKAGFLPFPRPGLVPGGLFGTKPRFDTPIPNPGHISFGTFFDEFPLNLPEAVLFAWYR